jgi:hypothetical protein
VIVLARLSRAGLFSIAMADAPKPKRTELRRHARIPVKVYADLYWEGADRRMTFERAQCLDVSARGLRLRLPGRELQTGTSVHVRIDKFGFAEYGIVRYALGHGIVGVEFRFETAGKEQTERWNRLVSSLQHT